MKVQSFKSRYGTQSISVSHDRDMKNCTQNSICMKSYSIMIETKKIPTTTRPSYIRVLKTEMHNENYHAHLNSRIVHSRNEGVSNLKVTQRKCSNPRQITLPLSVQKNLRSLSHYGDKESFSSIYGERKKSQHKRNTSLNNSFNQT